MQVLPIFRAIVFLLYLLNAAHVIAQRGPQLLDRSDSSASELESGDTNAAEEVSTKPRRVSKTGIAGFRRNSAAQVAFCSKRESRAQARHFLGPDPQSLRSVSLCASEYWVAELANMSMDGTLVFMDSDCGEGYLAASVFDSFVADAHIYPRAVFAAWGGNEGHCGSCGECHKQPHPLTKPNSRIEYHCFSPTAALTSLVAKLSSSADPMLAKWRMNPAQLLQTSDEANNLLSVDDFMARNNVQLVQLLNVGQGVAPSEILRGAKSTVRARKVLMFRFQYDSSDYVTWPKNELYWVVMHLFKAGYVCFMEGPTEEFARLTACWLDTYVSVPRARILCMHDTHVLRHYVEGHTYAQELHAKVLQEEKARLLAKRMKRNAETP